MTGRGVDQILKYPSKPALYEPYVKDAREYVALAESANGKIAKPVDFSYIWGDAVVELKQSSPDCRIINLETSITTSEDYWTPKGINYRMNPKNTSCLTEAKINCCGLANNHILDWGYEGLTETVQVLRKAGILCCGAGGNIQEASLPVVLNVAGKGRVLVFSYGSPDSGVPPSWAASELQAGVNFLEDYSEGTIQSVSNNVKMHKRRGDIVVFSVHWGDNWGYSILKEHKVFARRLIDEAAVDLVHGHSSHHVKGVEVYNGKLILYGCGDFLNDYEGIEGYEEFRGDLSLMYFPTLEVSTGNLTSMTMVPMQIKNFKLNRVSFSDAEWLTEVLSREGQKLGTSAELDAEGRLRLSWRK